MLCILTAVPQWEATVLPVLKAAELWNLAARTWSQRQKLNSLMPLHITEHHNSHPNYDLVIVQRKKAQPDTVQL